MLKVVLIGNPNVGKSVIFSRLTGINVISSNYPGTTVEYTEGEAKFGGQKVKVFDVPGIYTLEPLTKAEEIASSFLAEADVVINVVDSTNLERNLYLTLQLQEIGARFVVVLNMWDEARHKGICIDAEKLEKILKVPVICTCAITGEGIKELVERLSSALPPSKAKERTKDERWAEVGAIVEQIQSIYHRHHTLKDVLEELTIKFPTGLLIAAGVIYGTFKGVQIISHILKTFILEPAFSTYTILLKKAEDVFPQGLLHELLFGTKDIPFGLLNIGVYVPIVEVLPYIFSFYILLGLLEDFGYLPRLATLLDGLLHRFGMHGYAIVPFALGFGCNVPGIIATRVLESKKERFICATTMSIGIPCAALQAMIFGVLGKYGAVYIGVVYLTLFLIWIVLAFFLNLFVKGFCPELLLEIPPYRIPSLYTLSKKLLIRIKGFLKEGLPICLGGIFFANLLYRIGVLSAMGKFFTPLQYLFGLPEMALFALFLGFLRKDIAMGILATLSLSAKQLVIAATVMATFFPCIATFAMLWREMGIKWMLLSTLVMLLTSLAIGGFLNAII